jgi:hypothetical protein
MNVTIAWRDPRPTANQNPVKHVLVQRSSGGGAAQTIGIVGPKGQSFTDADVPAGTHRYSVVVEDIYGRRSRDEFVDVTVPTEPAGNIAPSPATALGFAITR